MFDSIAEALELELLFRDSQMNFEEFCSLMLQIHSEPSSARHGFIHDLRGALLPHTDEIRELEPLLQKARRLQDEICSARNKVRRACEVAKELKEHAGDLIHDVRRLQTVGFWVTWPSVSGEPTSLISHDHFHLGSTNGSAHLAWFPLSAEPAPLRQCS